ncbi:hypothetical protein A5623_27390 [Mycobacterium colombiense]|nr:hypothetical protein A5623_27390 [Mycobacterium colombiense]
MSMVGNSFECATTVATRKSPSRRRSTLAPPGASRRAAAAFGAVLYTVVTGDSIVSALTNIIGRALNTKV